MKKKAVKIKKETAPKNTYYVGKDWKVIETIYKQKKSLLVDCGKMGLSEDKTGRIAITIEEK